MIHPVESASPSRAAGIQRGEDEAQRRRWTFYEGVNLKTANPVLRFEVVSTGVLIFKKSDLMENSYELSALHEYRDSAHVRTMQAGMLEERKKRWS